MMFCVMFKSSKVNKCTLLYCHKKWGGLVVKDLGFEDQFSQMKWVVINGGKLTKYSLPK
jgi:hypothetical protein